MIVSLQEWQTATPENTPELRLPPLSRQARATLEAINARRQVEILEVRDGLRIQTRRFVGTLQLENLTLVIQPRMSPGATSTLLRYAYDLPQAPAAELSSSPLQGAGFPDLLGQLLLAEVDRLMLRGLFQDYQPVQQWLSSPRGKIDFAAVASRPIPTRVGLPCRYSPRVPELPLNQVVPAAIRSLLPCLRTGWLSSRLHQRERTWTDLCGASPLNLDLLQRAEASLDRRSRYYRPVLDLAWLIYRARSFGFAATETANLPQMIFDMANLFERVVARLCQEYAPPGLRIEAQGRNYQAYHWQANPQNWRRPQLRPDLVVRNSRGKVCLVLDTKYKDLDRKQFSPADLYQMTLYALSYASPVVVVYPTSSAEEAGRLHFRPFHAENINEIRFMGISLGQIASALATTDRVTLGEIVSLMVDRRSIDVAAPQATCKEMSSKVTEKALATFSRVCRVGLHFLGSSRRE